MTNVLYNPLSDNRHGEENAKKIAGILKAEELKYTDLTKIDLRGYLNTAPPEAETGPYISSSISLAEEFPSAACIISRRAAATIS